MESDIGPEGGPKPRWEPGARESYLEGATAELAQSVGREPEESSGEATQEGMLMPWASHQAELPGREGSEGRLRLARAARR